MKSIAWTKKTDGRRRLAAIGLKSEDLLRQVTLYAIETQRVDVDRRVRVRGHVSGFRPDDERVGVARLARGGEVPLRRET